MVRHMTKEQIQTYTLRVSQASGCELIVILYDIILEDVEAAKAAKASGDIEAWRADLKHAMRFVNELQSILDFSVPLSYQLASLYIYVNRQLTRAWAGGKEEPLADVVMVIEKLRAGFEGIRDQDEGGPVMQNVQQVYAVLTYGKGSLNETYLNPQDYNRGFRA